MLLRMILQKIPLGILIILLLGAIFQTNVYALSATIRPNGDSTPLQWTTTGSSHYTEIDEVVTQPTAGTTTDSINNGGSSGNADQLQMSSISPITQATAITVWVYGYSTKAGNMSVDLYYNGSIQNTSQVSLSPSYGWASTTFSGLTLTQSQLDGLEIYVTGDAGGRTYYVATLYADVTYSYNVLSVDIVDSGGTSITSPSIAMSSGTVSFSDQTTTGTFGISSERIRVSNTTTAPAWTLSLAASGGATDTWNGTTNYDYNDPTANGGDGSDTDGLGGQLTINPSGGAVSPQGGCTTTGITLGSSTAYNEETAVNSITLLSAGGTADTNCYWDLTDVGVSQLIPPEQPADSYSIDMVLSIIAS